MTPARGLVGDRRAVLRATKRSGGAAREDLTAEVRAHAHALALGADLVGIASVDRFAGAPAGHHPSDWLRGCRSVIVLALRQLEAAHDWPRMVPGPSLVRPEHRRDVLQEYWFTIVNHDVHDAVLDQMALRLALYLQGRGHASLFHEASPPPAVSRALYPRMTEPHVALFSHRHAAARAGLGEFGLNNLVITPEHGPYVRFVSVLTAADLLPDPLLNKKACLGVKCSLCLEPCGGHVLTLLPEARTNAVWLDPVSRTDRVGCVERRKAEHCRGQCAAWCPVGHPLRATRKRRRAPASAHP